MSRRTLWAVLVVVAAALGLSACESSQDKSRRLAKKGNKILHQKGLEVTRQNAQVKVVQTTALTDKNGSAAVVVLRNTSGHDLAQLPIAVDVLGAGGRSLYKNSAAGIEESLTSTAVLPAKGELAWVNDQVTASTKPVGVKATVGEARGKLPASLPAIVVGPSKLGQDPVSGVEATGMVRNGSKIDQLKLILYCVARRGNRIVAAGRGEIQRLAAGKAKKYHIFFIGNPTGAKLTVAAPPTVTA